MRLAEYVRERRWEPLLGYALFVSVLAGGYYDDLTFVQLGLIDLGTRLVGLSRFSVPVWMAALALVAFVAAIATGVALDRTGASRDLRRKLRLLWVVVAVQFALTLVVLSGQYGESPGVGILGVFAGFLAAVVAAVAVWAFADRLSGVAAATLVAYGTFGVAFLGIAGLRYVNVPGADDLFTFPVHLGASLLVAVVVTILAGRERRPGTRSTA